MKVLSAVLVAIISIALLGGAVGAPAAPRGPSTFDLYAPFLSNTVQAGSDNSSEFLVTVKSINPDRFLVGLSLSSSSPCLVPVLDRRSVLITKIKPQARLLLRVKVASGAPEGTDGFVTIRANRGSEVHDIHLQVTVRTSKPGLELGVDNGTQEQALQLSKGAPVEVSLIGTNQGAAATTFPLSAQVPSGWGVQFKDEAGQNISQVSIGGMKHYVSFPPTVALKAVVQPPAGFPENPPTTVTLSMGDSSTTVRIAKQGMLWAANDMSGIYPHVHQVRSGGTTTYKLQLTNTTGAPAAFALTLRGAPAGWKATLSQRAFAVPVGETREAELVLTTADGAPVGQAATITVEARGGGKTDSVNLAARVNNTPKVYYFSIDSMSYDYLGFDSAGTGQGGNGNWLMPNIHRFMGDSVSYSNASALLPAATDMNHTSALSGCYPGTEGIYCVSMSFNGTTDQGRMVTQPTSMDHCMTLQNGQPVKVERIFELAKKANPEALCAFVSNKSWLTDLESDPETQTAVERSISSASQPVYIPPVEKYVLGDPPSDGDPLLDPMQKSTLEVGLAHMITEKTGPLIPGGTEPVPRPILNLIGNDILESMNALVRWLVLPANIGVGSDPHGFANDSYFGRGLLSLIQQEDPDVTYTNLGELDETGHLVGSAEDQSEWETKGTAQGRDDDSRISNYAVRDDAIDVARQADIIFGQFIDTLKARGVYDSSIIVMMADHGMHNYKRPEKGYTVLDNRELLRSSGYVMGTDYDYDVGMMDYDVITSHNKSNLPAIEQVLEDYTVQDPVEGTIHPLVVYNRAEMKSGNEGRTGRKGLAGEFYSSYWVSQDALGADTMKWPDLVVYATHKYYTRIYADTATSGANAVGIKAEVSLPANLSIMATGGHISFDTTHVPLMFKAPGVRPGRVESTVYLSDIAPTIYQMMGWNIPSYVDGKPLPLK